MPKNKPHVNQEGVANTKRRRVEEIAKRDEDDEESMEAESADEGDIHSETLSEYEKKRLQNIENNNAFLAELNLNQAKQEFHSSIKASKPSKMRGLLRPKRIPSEELNVPRRQSLRIQRLDPGGEPLPTSPVPTPAVDEHRPYFARPVKAVGLRHMKQYSSPQGLDQCPRKPPGPLKMEPVNDVEQAPCESFLSDLRVLSTELAERKCGRQSGDKPKHDNSNSYEASLKRLRVKEGNIAKIVPQRIFSLAFHPSEEKPIVFAGDKWGRLGIWDVNSSRGEEGVFLFEPHSRPINCMAVDPLDCSRLYTCSYDGSMRYCDVDAAVFQEVYSAVEDVRLMHFAFGSPSARTVLIGDDNGDVLVVDARTRGKNSSEQRYEVHSRTIKCLDVHPHNSSLFVTSSNDCTLALWDLRCMKNHNSKLSGAQRSHSVTSAYFSPLTGSQIVSASLDDYVAVYDVGHSGKLSTAPKCLFRHDNHVGRWLTGFRATWDPKSDTYFVVGSMNRPQRQIDIYSSEKPGAAAMNLRDENLNSINSLNVFHPSLNMLAGANSSGKVYFWSEHSCV